MQNQHDPVYCILFIILRPFGTRDSIKQKVDHGGQILLLYWQHATNLARAIVFVVYMSSTRVQVWVRGKGEQKCSLTFCVFGQIKNKCSSSSTSPSRSLDKAFLHMAHLSTNLPLPQAACCHTKIRPELSIAEHN
jgi:hypothetical protein